MREPMLKWLVWCCISNYMQKLRMRGAYESNVDTGDTAATKVACAGNHLVDNLAGICLQAEHHLEVVCPALCVLAGRALDADVWAAVVAHLLQRTGDRLALCEFREVEGLDVGVALLDEVDAPVGVDHDDLGCAVKERELGGHLANGACSPDSDDVALLHAGVDDCVP
jgi:hypothetical protein